MTRTRLWTLSPQGASLYSEYILPDPTGPAILSAGHPIISVEVGPADARLSRRVPLTARIYGPEHGAQFLAAIKVTYKTGSRMWAE